MSHFVPGANLNIFKTKDITKLCTFVSALYKDWQFVIDEFNFWMCLNIISTRIQCRCIGTYSRILYIVLVHFSATCGLTKKKKYIIANIYISKYKNCSKFQLYEKSLSLNSRQFHVAQIFLCIMFNFTKLILIKDKYILYKHNTYCPSFLSSVSFIIWLYTVSCLQSY